MKDLDFMKQVAIRIAERSKEAPVTPDEVFDLFQNTFEQFSNSRIVEMPIFMPVKIDKKEDGFAAKSFVYERCCIGFGGSEEEAVEQLKQEIDRYNKTCIKTEKRMRMEEMIGRLFPKNELRQDEDQDLTLWNRILRRISRQISSPSFETWFKHTYAEMEGNTLNVECENSFQRDWLKERYESLISTVAEEVVGKEITIQFTFSEGK